MQDVFVEYYLWIKALHIIAAISWMAGMLYLPRLFVYHVGVEKGSDLSETLKTMERRLLKFIMSPAMGATWVFGLLMLYSNPLLLEQGWVHAKLLFILVLSGIHGIFSKWQKVFEVDENMRSAKFYKIWNEAPTVLMILIVILAVVKPF